LVRSLAVTGIEPNKQFYLPSYERSTSTFFFARSPSAINH